MLDLVRGLGRLVAHPTRCPSAYCIGLRGNRRWWDGFAPVLGGAAWPMALVGACNSSSLPCIGMSVALAGRTALVEKIYTNAATAIAVACWRR